MPKSTSKATPGVEASKKVLTEEEKRRKNQIWAWTDLKTAGNTLNLIFKNNKTRSYKLPKVDKHGKPWTIAINANTSNTYLRGIWKFIRTVYPLFLWFDVQRLRGRENDNAYLECEIAKSIHIMTTDPLESPDKLKPHLAPGWSNMFKTPQLIAKMIVKAIRRIAGFPKTIPIPDFDALEVMVRAAFLSEKKKGGDTTEKIVVAKDFNDCGQSALYLALRLKCELVTSEYDENSVNLANVMFSIGRGMAPLFNFCVEQCNVCLESELNEAVSEAANSDQKKSVILLTNMLRRKTEKCPDGVLVLVDTPRRPASVNFRKRRRHLKSCGIRSGKKQKGENFGILFFPIGSIYDEEKKQLHFVYKSDKMSSRGLIARTLVDNALKIKTHRVFFKKYKISQLLEQRNQKKEPVRRKRNTKAPESKKNFKRRHARQKTFQLSKEAEIEKQNENIIEELMEDGLTSKRIVQIFERNRGNPTENFVNTEQIPRSLRNRQKTNYKTDDSKESNRSDEDKNDKEYIPLDHESRKFRKLNNSKKSSKNVIEKAKHSKTVAPVVKISNNEQTVENSNSPGLSGSSATPSTPDELPNEIETGNEVPSVLEENREENNPSLQSNDHDSPAPTLGDIPTSSQSHESESSANSGDEMEQQTTKRDLPTEEPTYGSSSNEEPGELQQEITEVRTENGGEQQEDGMEFEMDCAVTSSNDIFMEPPKPEIPVELNSQSDTIIARNTSPKNVLPECDPGNSLPQEVQNLEERQIVSQQHQHSTGHVHSPDSDYHSATDSNVSPELMEGIEAASLSVAVAEVTPSFLEDLSEQPNCSTVNLVDSTLKRNRSDSCSDKGADTSLTENMSEKYREPSRPKRPCPRPLLSKEHVGNSINGTQSTIDRVSSVANHFLEQPWCEKAVQDGKISRSDSEQAALMISMWSVMPNPAQQLEQMAKSLMERQKAEEDRIQYLNKQKAEEEQKRLMAEHVKREAERRQLEAENERVEAERRVAAERQQQEMAQILNLHVLQFQTNQNVLQTNRQASVPISGRTPHPTRLPQLEQEEAGHPILRVQNRHVIHQPVQNAPTIHGPSTNHLQLLQNIAHGIPPPAPHFHPGQQPVIAPIPLRIAPQFPVLPPASVQLPNFGLQLNPAIFPTMNFAQQLPFTPETLAFIQQYNGFQ